MTDDTDLARTEWVSAVEPPSFWRRLLPAAALIGLGVLLLVTGTGVDGDQPEPGQGLTVGQEDDDPADPETAPDEEEPPARAAEPVDRLPGAAGELYAMTGDSIVRVDLASGERTVRELQAVGHDHGGWGATVAVAGETIVYQHADASLPVLALPRDLEGEPVELAGQVTDDHPGPGDMMQAVYPASEDAVTVVVGGYDGGPELQTFDVVDGEVRETVRLPTGAAVVHVTGRSAVVALAGEIFRYDLDAEEGERLAIGTPVAADDEGVLFTRCSADLSCVLLSRNFDADASRRLGPAPHEPVGFFFGGGAALSPDRRWLRYTSYGAGPSLQVVDLESGASHQPPRQLQRAVRDGRGRPTLWTPDGSWLLQPAHTTVWAWHPGRDEVLELDLGLTRVHGIAVAP